ncbi:MAG: GtrA family protein [Pseudomonadales bacterium]
MNQVAASQQKQFVKFLVAGTFAAAANFGSRFLYNLFWSFEIAVVLAFATGLTTGYLLSRYFVFNRSRHSAAKEMLLFFTVNMVALAQTWLVSIYLADYLINNNMDAEAAYALAHFAGICCPLVTSYFGHRYFTFKA